MSSKLFTIITFERLIFQIKINKSLDKNELNCENT